VAKEKERRIRVEERKR